MIIYNEIVNWISGFVQTELFQNFALFFIYLVAASPSFFFLPNETVTIPAYLIGVNPILMVVAIGLGGFTGDTIMFLSAKHIHRKLSGTNQKKVSKWMYSHKHLIFLISPSAFFGIGDAILVIAALKHFHYKSLALFLLAGNFIRGVWGMLFVIYGVELFDWLF